MLLIKKSVERLGEECIVVWITGESFKCQLNAAVQV